MKSGAGCFTCGRIHLHPRQPYEIPLGVTTSMRNAVLDDAVAAHPTVTRERSEWKQFREMFDGLPALVDTVRVKGEEVMMAVDDVLPGVDGQAPVRLQGTIAVSIDAPSKPKKKKRVPRPLTIIPPEMLTTISEVPALPAELSAPLPEPTAPPPKPPAMMPELSTTANPVPPTPPTPPAVRAPDSFTISQESDKTGQVVGYVLDVHGDKEKGVQTTPWEGAYVRDLKEGDCTVRIVDKVTKETQTQESALPELMQLPDDEDQ